MANARTAISIFGMARVEPHVQGKRLALRLVLDEFNAPIGDQFRFMTQAAIGLWLIKGIASDRLNFVEMVFAPIAFRHFGVPFTKVASAVSLLP